jgi:hypothetical protein
VIEKLRALGQFSNLEPDRLDQLAARLRRPADRAYQARSARLGGLRKLAGDGSQSAPGSPRILVAALRGWSVHVDCELIIAHGLRLRGAKVALLTCGGGMPACEVGWARRAYPRPCDRCGWFTDRLAAGSGLEHFALRDYFDWGRDGRRAPQDTGELRPPAEAYIRSRISLTWLMRVTRIDRLPEGPLAREDFAVAADAVARAGGAVFDDFRPDIVFLLNGLFGAESALREVALERGLRAPTYEIAPRAGCIVASQRSPAPYYDTDVLWERVRDQPLTERQRADTVALLDARAAGVGAHESYFDKPEENLDALRRHLELPSSGRVATLFTNVSWDSATFARDVGFGSMFEWIIESIRAVDGREDLTLMIRVHPGEERWGTRESVETVVREELGQLPSNVRMISASQPISSYALLALSDLVLTYTTTLGLEAAARGKPVAVAGETHYRRRGFTIDLDGPEMLSSVLRELPGPIDLSQVEQALRYAFAFFFRSMLPFPAVRARGAQVTHLPGSERDLAPGADPYLDWICDRILDGKDFDLPDELILAPTGPLAAA